jgi:DNA-binding NtrC family response regulator
MASRSPILLFVDDEPDILDIARMCFEMGGWKVHTADGVEAAKTVLRREAIDVVLSDVMMKGASGMELLYHVRSEYGPEFIFYLLTGCIDDRVKSAVELGANGVFNKPCDWNDVVAELYRAVQGKLQIQPT